ncbi:MAG: hypothetical protein FJ098_08480 [Deltaproteobacteria bacterium]|nr:hypothetical protein [Deltaproteobacteria bacterium]
MSTAIHRVSGAEARDLLGDPRPPRQGVVAAKGTFTRRLRYDLTAGRILGWTDRFDVTHTLGDYQAHFVLDLTSEMSY